jgi:phenylalanyl-tRNA synthetase beta chain
LSDFIVGEIIEHGKHPDADKLSLLKVSDGTNTYQVICGAPNCYKGLKGVFAKAGTIIPCYNEELKVSKIRGLESFGMMCSEKELLLSDDHNTIIELPKDTKVGIPADQVLNVDPVFDISITPNRAECLGVRGIARDLAAAGLGKLKPLNIKKTPEKFKSPISVSIDEDLGKACSVYIGRYIKGINNKAETPKWMKDRLIAIGLRSISPLVDITNYINYDLARPLHVFDADKLKGNVLVRMAKEGEKFLALDEKEYTLDNQSVGICDDEGVQCLGGIMGGLNKGCTENTVNVFLEAALFDPENIARTGRKFQIMSDSRYRYERWVDPRSNILGSDYATQLILEICGGEASDLQIAGDEEKFKPRTAYIRPERLQNAIGIEVSEAKIIEILSNLGFQVAPGCDGLKAISPTWRGDIEGEHDLVEEVVRMIGLDNIPAISMPMDLLPKQALTPKQRRVVTVRHELAMQGLYETVTWSFTDSNIAKLFMTKDKKEAKLANPISAELDQMRPSILTNLLLGVKNNIARGNNNVGLFEVASEFYGPKPTEQTSVAAGVRSGNLNKKSYLTDSREVDALDAKADAISAIAAANGPADNLQITNDAPHYYHPGRSGAFRLGKNVLAYFGEVHPNILKKMGIKQRVCAFEVFLDNIPEARTSGTQRKKLELSAFQAVDKDLAFVVDKSTPAGNIVQAARGADKDNIVDVRVFDVYEGKNMPDGKKSIAIALTFQPREKTYTDADIETLMNKVIQSVKSKCGGELRA